MPGLDWRECGPRYDNKEYFNEIYNTVALTIEWNGWMDYGYYPFGVLAVD